MNWFKEEIFDNDQAFDTLKWLAHWPKHNVITCSEYDINKYSFYTSMNFFGSKAKNTIMWYISLESIKKYEVDYTNFKVLVLKYEWVNNNNSVQFDHIGHKQEPLIMSYQTKQSLLCHWIV